MSYTILQGDVRDQLRTLSAGSARTCVTSPPYWGLRDYGVSGQLGLEPTPDAYVAALVEVFRDVSFRLAPLDRAAAHAMIGELKGYPLLAGARGRAPVDLERLVDALVALGEFGAANAGSIRSVDINPFIALPAGGVAVDALIVR